MTGDEPVDGSYLDRLVDRDRLETYLESVFGPADAFEVEHLGEGHSNETLRITWGQEEFALRRPPPGETADTAHDVLREYRVIDALQGELPVPPTVESCDDHSVVGSDFYITELLEGDVIRETEPERFAAPAHRRRIGEELIDTLTEIHTVDYEAVGLGDFGRPEGYLERQVDRMTKQIEWATERTERERTVPELEEVGRWLSANVPDSPTHTLVHGDYKLDNVMFGPGTPPELVAAFDWELSTLGDPLADLGWLFVFWRDEADPDPAIPEVVPSFTEHEGYPTRGELVDRYEERTGIAFENQAFYRTFALYKVAAACEMFYARYLEGDSDDSLYAVMDERVPAVAKRALEATDESGWSS
ncbi:phosphotransferase family protein [Natronomonas marina]|jgi:aminoglycoside phosphotransferase (APT) family kinase protein|uniref:phosphotransferase family protein n=1 Tax=Natronomonas marina TaxID=2961939 RepID=UPI0020CA1C73|nr:phosphotransferase family protein [Natronomonas marina]